MRRWSPIPGFSLFEASDDGYVRRVCYAIFSKGPRRPLPAIMGTKTSRQGYLDVCVSRDGERQKWWRVHRLVALAFHGEPPDGSYMVCHRDGDKQNNTPRNLYWGTHVSNGADCRRHRTFADRRERFEHPTSRLKPEDVRAIRDAIQHGVRTADLADAYEVSRSTISMISTGRNWGWLQ